MRNENINFMTFCRPFSLPFIFQVSEREAGVAGPSSPGPGGGSGNGGAARYERTVSEAPVAASSAAATGPTIPVSLSAPADAGGGRRRSRSGLRGSLRRLLRRENKGRIKFVSGKIRSSLHLESCSKIFF